MATISVSPEAAVFVVDDDDAVRESLAFLLKSVGLRVESFASAQDFLKQYNAARAGCLVLDIRMPGMSGLELQDKLSQMGSMLPIIFITGHGDVPMAVKAIKAGAADFVQKPFRDQELIDRIREVLEEDASARVEKLQKVEI
ncbi:MAG TPA: response regulator transcription factor, partial [Pseudomonadales bacterium]|nr:response regulator transcription factor [Pseudomonadales bacterium]